MTFNFGSSHPYLLRARLALEPHGFTHCEPTASAARRGKYRFLCPDRRSSIYVYAPVAPTGNPRSWGRLWQWGVYGNYRYAQTLDNLVKHVCDAAGVPG